MVNIAKHPANPIDIHVGTRIKLMRKIHKLNQTKLGEAVGLSFQQIQKYETGANRIGASRMFEFSQIFNVPVSYFFDAMPEHLGVGQNPDTIIEDPFEGRNMEEASAVAKAYYAIKDKPLRHAMRALVKEASKSQ